MNTNMEYSLFIKIKDVPIFNLRSLTVKDFGIYYINK